jgi:O-antigen/teichoic acid export membrane protein
MTQLKEKVKGNFNATLFQHITLTFIHLLGYSYISGLENALESIGLIAIIVSATGILGILDFGIPSSVLYYVARSKSNNFSMSVVYIALLLVLLSYTLFVILINTYINIYENPFLSGYQISTTTINLILITGFFNAVANTLFSFYDAFNKMWIRATSLTISSVIFYLLILAKSTEINQINIVYAILFQGFFSLVLPIYFLIRKGFSAKLTVKFLIIKNLVSFSSKVFFQKGTQALTEPLLKIIILASGGLAALGIFEVANKVISSFYRLFISVNRIILPTYSSLNTGQKKNSIMVSHYKINILMSTMLFMTLYVSSPIIGVYFNMQGEAFFSIYYLLLAGWFFHSISLPSYFINAADKVYLKFNSLSSFVTMIFVVIIWILSLYLKFSLREVVYIYMLGIVAGSVIVMTPNFSLFIISRVTLKANTLVLFVFSCLVWLAIDYNYSILFSTIFLLILVSLSRLKIFKSNFNLLFFNK